MMHYLFVGSTAALKRFLFSKVIFTELYSFPSSWEAGENMSKNSGYADPVWINTEKIKDGFKLIQSLFPARPRVVVWECNPRNEAEQDMLRETVRIMDKNQSILVLNVRKSIVLDERLRSRLLSVGRPIRPALEFVRFEAWAFRYSRRRRSARV